MRNCKHKYCGAGSCILTVILQHCHRVEFLIKLSDFLPRSSIIVIFDIFQLHFKWKYWKHFKKIPIQVFLFFPCFCAMMICTQQSCHVVRNGQYSCSKQSIFPSKHTRIYTRVMGLCIQYLNCLVFWLLHWRERRSQGYANMYKGKNTPIQTSYHFLILLFLFFLLWLNSSDT